MAKKTKKDGEEVVTQPAVDSAQEFYKNDPEVKQDASGDMIFTANPSARAQMGATTDSVETKAAPLSGLSKLYETSATAFSNAETARKAYDQAYTDLGDAYKAIADIMKPKDRTAEQKRMRNVALAQAIGQGIAAIFGAAYAGKRGGRVVMPEDFASKSLAKAEELREKGLLEEREYAKLMSDLRLNEANAKVKKLGGDYATVKADYDRAQAAIAEYEKMQHQQEFQQQQAKENREFQQQQAKDNRESQTAEAEKTRQYNLQIRQQDALEKAKGIFAGVDDATISMTMGFLPKTRSEARKRTDEYGTTQYYYETVPAQSWTEEEYKSALNQARAYINGIKGYIGDANVQELAKSNSLVEIDELLKNLSQSKNQKYDWNYVANLLKNGVRVGELVPFLSTESKNNGK